MEKYTINLSNGWSIEAGTNQKDDAILSQEDDTILKEFGQEERVNGVITWIYDPFIPRDEIIELCEKDKAYLQKVSFKVMQLKGDDWKEIEEFEGTFIDALKYIQKVYHG